MDLLKQYPLVSILVLNWNGLSFTRKCLKSLLSTKYPNFEIVLLDNGSLNNEAEIIRKEFKNSIKVIKNEKNVGYARGMDIAYKSSRGAYVAFVNNDMEFSKDWLGPMVQVLEKNEKIGACQPKLISFYNKEYFDYASAAGGFMDIFGYPFARGRIFTHVEKDKRQYDKIIKISWNGIFLAKREVLDKTGLFNPIYFNYGEDMDLSFRIYGQGYTLVNVPQAVAYHYNSETLKNDMIKKMYFHHRNNIILIVINWPMDYLWFVLPTRFALDILAIFYYCGVNFIPGAIGIVKAYVSLAIMFPQIIKERRVSQKLIKRENISMMPIYKGSIVFQYFVLRHKKFEQVIRSKGWYVV